MAESAPEPALPDPDADAAPGRLGLFVDGLVDGALLIPALLAAYAILAAPPVPAAIIVASSIAGALLQAWIVSAWRRRSAMQELAGSLIAPAVCTVGHVLALGREVGGASHLALAWGAALVVGVLQLVARRSRSAAMGTALIGVQVVLGLTVVLMAWLLNVEVGGDWGDFLDTSAERFLGVGIALLTLALGWARTLDARLLDRLNTVSRQLRTYSEWLLGRTLLQRAITDREVLAPERRNRAIMFADIRGFTAWSESRSPEEVLAMLAGFYGAVEESLRDHEVVKLKYTADEAMAVFADPRSAAIATLALRDATMRVLTPHGLGVGIGLHSGPVIEGLVGGPRHKGFDVLGDTVNTAKRICDQAAKGEVLISYLFYTANGGKLRTGDERSAKAKGKSSALLLSPLAGVI